MSAMSFYMTGRVPASRACNYLQNVGATTYKKFLQFYAKKSCKKHLLIVTLTVLASRRNDAGVNSKRSASCSSTTFLSYNYRNIKK